MLPTFALTLGLWAVEAAGALGVYDPAVTLYAAQELVVHRPLPASGAVETAARIVGVWDRGRAAMVDV